jgi:deazaflavin-dependent oxidoreductase (nitroreductase family)
MRAYSALVRQLGRTRAFASVASRLLPPLDLRLRGHPPTASGTDFPLCYLTVRRRGGGELRTLPLLHIRDGERVVVIASNWGKPKHPAWAFDLQAAGCAIVERPGEPPRELSARRAGREEFDRYWAEALRFWPGYEGYRRRAGREIRMFVLEPRATG